MQTWKQESPEEVRCMVKAIIPTHRAAVDIAVEEWVQATQVETIERIWVE